MERSPRRFSGATEFVLVTLVCYWWAIAANAVAVAGHLMRVSVPVTVNDGQMLTLAGIELVGLMAASWVGRARGWSVWSFGLRPTWRGTGAGVVLAAATAIALTLLGLVVNAVYPGSVRFEPLPGSLSLAVVLLVSAVNPVFEEAMGVGYFIHALRRFGAWPAVLASAGFRTFLHAYQGFNAVVIVLPLGIAFAVVYLRYGRLWPLVVAHAVFSLAALLPLARTAEPGAAADRGRLATLWEFVAR
jgi:membrane protease YdiL (CAAX protease family)